MILDRKEKQSYDVKDYPIGYGEWLAESNDTISSVDVIIECQDDPSDTSLSLANLLQSPTEVSVWLQGGTPDRSYKITVRITTNGGLRDESEFILRIKEY